ncbi:MAG TPA: undecaprenyl-diphosphate phosphatase [Candidatus Paceibacterota bacterium]|jgi:undecaprenyl-diphosphatase|nr:undecaprenyl-diphosphate phosphatase [Candidatus Paceibacterota bacterium]
MLTFTQAIVLGIIQGLTELFPISSLGHSVLIPSLLGWNLDQSASFFVVFLVATHLATALVLIIFYFRDWIRIAQGFLRSVIYRRVASNDVYAKLAWLLITATIPAGLLGLIFQKKLGELFASPHIVAVFLLGNGILLFAIEKLKRRTPAARAAKSEGNLALDTSISRLSAFQALRAGTMQVLALLPGFSRTGASLGGGLLAGLDHAAAARFSFLLATPIILAAAALKLPVLFTTQGYPVSQILAGMAASAAAAFLSILFLTRYFRTRTLLPFAYYCMLAGAGSIIFFLFH